MLQACCKHASTWRKVLGLLANLLRHRSVLLLRPQACGAYCFRRSRRFALCRAPSISSVARAKIRLKIDGMEEGAKIQVPATIQLGVEVKHGCIAKRRNIIVTEYYSNLQQFTHIYTYSDIFQYFI